MQERAMAETRREHTNTFDAIATDGTTYTIHAFTEYHAVFGHRVEGLPFFRSKDGTPVNHTGKGTYVVVDIPPLP
jgi:hypothetical protein